MCGNSLNVGVNKVFAFFHNPILPHDSEVQFMKRVPQPKLSGVLDPVVDVFICPGIAGRHEACYDRTLEALLLNNDTNVDSLVLGARADIQCAYRDTQNRHRGESPDRI